MAEVNEQGTEAGAGTAVALMETAPLYLLSIPAFRADHPFLFVGRVVKPPES